MKTVNESMIPAAAQLLGVSASELGAALHSLGKQGVPERLLSRKQAAAYIGVTYGTIKSWADTGRLPQHKLGYKTVKYRQSDIDKLLNAAKQVGGAEQQKDAPLGVFGCLAWLEGMAASSHLIRSHLSLRQM